jgi:hypothetical protein
MGFCRNYFAVSANLAYALARRSYMLVKHAYVSERAAYGVGALREHVGEGKSVVGGLREHIGALH